MRTMRKTWQNVLYIALLLAGIFLLFWWYSSQNSQRIENQNLNYAMDSARQTARRIDGELANGQRRMRNYACILIATQDRLEVSADLLREMEENAAFDAIHFVNAQGISMTSDGTTADCSDRDYYLNGMQGESGSTVIFQSRFTGQAIMLFYTPVRSDDQVCGVLAGLYYAEHYLQEMLATSYFGEEADAYLCARHGDIIASSSGSRTEGLLPDILRNNGIVDGETAEAMWEVFRDEVDEGSYICAPGSLTDNLCALNLMDGEYVLVRTFPKSVTQTMIRNANYTGMVLQAVLIGLFTIYILTLLLQSRRKRQLLMRESQEHITGLQLKERRAQAEISVANRKERQYRIAITSNAFNTFEFDLTRDLVEQDVVRTMDAGQISMLERVGLTAPCRASLCFDKWRAFVLEESLEDYDEAVNLDHLRERFEAGELEVDVDYWGWASADRQICVRQSFIMARDDTTGNIMVMVVSKDITDQVSKQREQTQALQEALMQAQRANSAKTTFLNNMSHDIRTPMNAIIGFTNIAVSHIGNKSQVEDCLHKVLSSSNHLLSLINDILDMSRIESGKVQIKEQECNISELTHNLVNIIQPQVKAKQLELFIDTIDVVNEDVIADSLKLSQVFVNLMSNAVKYTPAGGTVSFCIIQESTFHRGYGDYVFIVKDNGIGMAPEFVEHIFEPFEREASATKTGIQGTGLGMAITKNIVDMMGGKITVQSEKGKGSEFRVELSLKLQNKEEDAAVIQELEGLRTLVVDDDCDSCESVTKLLKQLGMRSEWTVSGREAVYRARSAHKAGDSYHTYIIDWQMPEMSGIETTRRIREAIGHDAPIIVLTAYDWTDIEEEAKKAGVTAFCAKPLFLSDLKSALMAAHDLTEQKETTSWTQADFSGKRILLVEDNELNREIAEAILQETGFTVESAPDGSDAVDMVLRSEEHYYDVVLMDVQMPVMDGYEVTRAIRALGREDVKGLPIIAMTANAMEEDKENALKSGMNAHIAKPIDIGLFLSVLGKFIK